MGPGSDFGLAPGKKDIGMMAFLFRDGADAVHESERGLEIGEGKRAVDVVVVHHSPLRHLLGQGNKLKALQGRDSAAAWNNIAAASASLHRYDEAIAAAQRAIALKPDFQLAKNNLAWALAQKAAGK